MLNNQHITVDTPHGIIDVYWTDEDFIVTYRKNAEDVMVELELPTMSDIRRARVESILGVHPFNPYDRDPL